MVAVIASRRAAVTDRVRNHVLDGLWHWNFAIRHGVVDRLDRATRISAVVSDAAASRRRLSDQSEIKV